MADGRIVIVHDFSTLNTGGALSLSGELIRSAHAALPEARHVVLARSSRIEAMATPHADVLRFESRTLAAWALLGAHAFPELRTARPLLVSYTNWLPVAWTGPSAAYVHNSYLVADAAPSSPSEYLRTWMFKRCLARADRFVVQTESIASQLRQRLDRIGRPNAVDIVRPEGSWLAGADRDDGVAARVLEFRGELDVPLVFYPSLPAAHKNIGRLLQAFERLNRAEVRAALVLPHSTGEEHRSFGKPSWLLELGGLELAGMRSAYENVDCCVFPSVFETAGLGLVEARCFGLRTAASDLPFAHELARSDTLFFDPESVADIERALHKLLATRHESAPAPAEPAGHRFGELLSAWVNEAAATR